MHHLVAENSPPLIFLFFISCIQNAYSVFKDHPQVISDKIGLLSLSLGSIVTIFLLAESAVVKASSKCTKPPKHSCILCPHACVGNDAVVVSAELQNLQNCVVFQPACAVCISGINIYLKGGNLRAVSELIAV